MASEEGEHGFGRATERGAARVQHQRTLDEHGVRGHGGDKGVPVGACEPEVSEGRLVLADKVADGAAKGGEGRANLGFGGRVLKVEPHLGRDAARFEKRECRARFGAAGIVPDRGQSQSPRPLPTASDRVAKPFSSTSTSSPRAMSPTSDRPP